MIVLIMKIIYNSSILGITLKWIKHWKTEKEEKLKAMMC